MEISSWQTMLAAIFLIRLPEEKRIRRILPSEEITDEIERCSVIVPPPKRGHPERENRREIDATANRA